MEFLARPGQLLKDHHKNVFLTAQHYMKDIGIEIEDFELVMKRICFFHDFGKYTSYFQKKLKNGVNNKHSRHSFISAVATAASLMEFVEKHNLESNDSWLKFSPLIGYMSVLAHHSDLLSIDEFLPEDDFCTKKSESVGLKIRENYDIALEQIRDITEKLDIIMKDYDELGIDLPKSLFQNDGLRGVLCSIENLFYRSYTKAPEEIKKQVALMTQLSYSLLIDSDKKDASGYVIDERQYIPSNIVKLFKTNFLKNEGLSKEIVNVRERLFNTVQGSVERIEINEDSGLKLKITAPTGAGKTLAALNAALILRERIYRKYGKQPRIIYALPLVSIIEQTKAVFEEILRQLEEYEKSPERFFIAHYHLTEAMERTSNNKAQNTPDLDEEYDSQNQFLIESWDSEIILTTFWQFFHTLLGYRNKLLKKFYKLYGSIIILDEPQSLPAELWPLVEEFVNMVSQYLRANIIMMSATQPALGKNWVELNKGYEDMFSNLSRTEIQILRNQADDFSKIVEFVLEQNYDKHSFLFVFNTVMDSVVKYKLIKEMLPNGSDTRLFYLSTNITPLDRMKRFKEIENALSSKKRVVLVSTQVVEAGVDLDFDVVVRELGPLTSIIQIAGRCNRNYRIDKAKVYVTNLDEIGARKVYGNVHFDATKEIVWDKDVISEQEYLALSKLYANIIEERGTKKTEAKKIARKYMDLTFSGKDIEQTLSDFQLIKYVPTYQIFICKNDEDESILERLISILQGQDKKELARIKRSVQERIVSVPYFRAREGLIPPSVLNKYETLRFVAKEDIHMYYDEEVGYKFFTSDLSETEALIW
jgi:CRISPR-associated endonuclease/helicase Cas3